MHDVNPLATRMHLRELDRQAAPALRAVPARTSADRRGAWIMVGLAKLLRRVRAEHARKPHADEVQV